MIGKLLRPGASLFLVLGIFFISCSQQKSPPAPDPELVLQAIPAANAAQLERIHDMRKWRNPYLIVRTDGVALFDSADDVEIHLKLDELLPALAKLPASSWPLGRVVAVTEMGAGNKEQDAVGIRKNRGIVGGLLQGAHIAINWVPPA